MRPIYETREDLVAENAFKKIIEAFTKSRLEKLSIKYYADFLAFREDKVRALIETKIRTNKMRDYDTYMISLDKVVNLLRLGEMLKIPVFLFVQWADLSGFVSLTRDHLCLIQMQSVNFREDKEDIEPCVFISIEEFVLLK